MTEATKQYDDWLLRTASTAIAEGASSLRAVVDRCSGADPLTVRAALCSVPHTGISFQKLGTLSFADRPVELSLPPPHPLDYEWRFSMRGTEKLLSGVQGASSVHFMGATTVAIAAARKGWRGRLVATDQSRVVVEAAKALGLPIELVLADLSRSRDGALNGEVDAVIIDPPWYLEHAVAFLIAAANECRRNGLILASLPGDGTRPGLSDERECLMNWAGRLGLKLQTVEPQSVAYETPYFERNAFRAAGLGGDLRSWRRGDLWVFKRIGRVSAVVAPEIELLHEWRECLLGRMRVRFRAIPMRSGDTRLQQLVDGDILPTVSRRDPRRATAHVWTSGNRVFGCKDPGTLFMATQARAQGLDEVEAAAVALERSLSDFEQRTLRESCDRLSDLMEQEQDEQAEVTDDETQSESVTA